MAITRWDPYRDLTTMQERVNRIFSDYFGRRADDEVLTRGAWIPPVDIYHTGKGEIVLKAELPGLKRDDIDLRVENHTLTLRGERRYQDDVQDEQYHRVERVYGTFSRSFSLPETIDTERVRADYKDGVLTVSLPVREEAKPKQIQVQVAG